MRQWTVAEIDGLCDKALAALAQLKAAEQNLLYLVKKLEKGASKDAVASADRPGPVSSE